MGSTRTQELYRKFPFFEQRIIRLYVYRRDRGMCAVCGEFVPQAEVALDHVLPVTYFGPHHPSNITVAHSYCNNAVKNNRVLSAEQYEALVTLSQSNSTSLLLDTGQDVPPLEIFTPAHVLLKNSQEQMHCRCCREKMIPVWVREKKAPRWLCVNPGCDLKRGNNFSEMGTGKFKARLMGVAWARNLQRLA